MVREEVDAPELFSGQAVGVRTAIAASNDVRNSKRERKAGISGNLETCIKHCTCLFQIYRP